ncbi:MAG TPA: 4'-phosphopantetheinyl transferase superfamily protein [Dyella sp.]|nr:4'-phosphopantetheinyl transferase superfamily protein [Dyella sp.]
MSEHVRPHLAKLAEPLGDDEIHVWSCAYRPASGRDPLRRLLARYLGEDPSALRLGVESHGRPVLEGPVRPPLRFNWTHSGDRALVAVARTVQPGIDLEHRARRRRDVLALARRFFAVSEAEAIEHCGEASRPLQFLRLWTCKEALLKAQGRGLAFGMERVAVALDHDRPELVAFDGESLADWQLHELIRDEGWVAALAWRGPALRVCWRGDFR